MRLEEIHDKTSETVSRVTFGASKSNTALRYLVIEPVPPSWRDCWAIARGTYEPKVRVYWRLTLRGMDKTLKQIYVGGVRDLLNEKSYLLDRLRGDDDG